MRSMAVVQLITCLCAHQAVASVGGGTLTTLISQFEGGHGFRPGATSCFKAARAMAHTAGVEVLGPFDRIQVGRREDRQGHLTVVDTEKAAEARTYLDTELTHGRPVVVGVSHTRTHYNVDGLTDHFVIVTSSGVDEEGHPYYTFHDPGTANVSRGQDSAPHNRFTVDEDTGMLYRPGKRARGYITDRRYEVSMVRLNAPPPP
jgi:hypothetical protein